MEGTVIHNNEQADAFIRGVQLIYGHSDGIVGAVDVEQQNEMIEPLPLFTAVTMRLFQRHFRPSWHLI